jgi:hypothetical protein
VSPFVDNQAKDFPECGAVKERLYPVVLYRQAFAFSASFAVQNLRSQVIIPFQETADDPTAPLDFGQAGAPDQPFKLRWLSF